MRSLNKCRRDFRARLLRRKQSLVWWITSALLQILFLAALVILLVSCATTPYQRAPDAIGEASIRPPDVTMSAYGTHSLELTVLTFNVAGLPWPIASGRANAITEIAKQIATLSDAGPQIDLVLIQEGFLSKTTLIGERLGHRYSTRGPGRHLRGNSFHQATEHHHIRRKWWKGERFGPWVGSGLHIFSAHPIKAVRRMVFGPEACAGYDCLANKGAVAAQILVPGLPVPLDIITTHLNSTRSAGVSLAEAHRAHAQQVEQLAAFWKETTDVDHPVITAGDLNIRGSHERFVPLARQFGDTAFVKNDCHEFGGTTHCAMRVRADAPWLSSQDVQVYRHGYSVLVEPLEAKTVLHEPVNGAYLSDHVGYLVRYRLSWRPTTVALAE